MLLHKLTSPFISFVLRLKIMNDIVDWVKRRTKATRTHTLVISTIHISFLFDNARIQSLALGGHISGTNVSRILCNTSSDRQWKFQLKVLNIEAYISPWKQGALYKLLNLYPFFGWFLVDLIICVLHFFHVAFADTSMCSIVFNHALLVCVERKQNHVGNINREPYSLPLT